MSLKAFQEELEKIKRSLHAVLNGNDILIYWGERDPDVQDGPRIAVPIKSKTGATILESISRPNRQHWLLSLSLIEVEFILEELDRAS